MVNYVLINNIDVVLCQDLYLQLGVAVGVPPDWPCFSSANKMPLYF